MIIWDILAAIFSGIVGAMGLGGGGVLVLYLTLVLSLNQLTAQGINLLFFLPCAVIALIIHSKRKLIQWKALFPVIIGGVAGIGLGTLLVNTIHTDIISKIFAGFLFIVGIIEIFGPSKKKKESENENNKETEKE